jgi:hypothetical protein
MQPATIISRTTYYRRGSEHRFRKDAGTQYLNEVSAKPARGPELLEIFQFIWIVFDFALSILIDYWAQSVWAGLVMFWILGLAGVGFIEILRSRRRIGRRLCTLDGS